jgi:hypothetical protein
MNMPATKEVAEATTMVLSAMATAEDSVVVVNAMLGLLS